MASSSTHELKQEDLPDVRAIVSQALDYDANSFRCYHNLSWLEGSATDAHPRAFVLKQLFDLWIVDGSGLDRLGDPLYLELSFNDNIIKPENRKDIINGIRTLASTSWNDSTVRQLAGMIEQTIQRTKDDSEIPFTRCFIPAETGHPFGSFFRKFGGTGEAPRSQHMKGLLIALHGHINSIPCEHCIQVFQRTVTISKEHVNTPFFDCISPSDTSTSLGGACAACVFAGQAKECSWYRFQGYRTRQSPSSPTRSPSFAFSGVNQTELGNDAGMTSLDSQKHPFQDSRRITGSNKFLTWDPEENKKDAQARAILHMRSGVEERVRSMRDDISEGDPAN